MAQSAQPALILALLVGALAAPTAASASEPMTISVDASTPWKRRIPVRLTLPTRPGPLALTFPRWLPGSHAPEAPLSNFARLNVSAGGAALEWRRDPYNPFLIRVDVPRGAERLEATYEYVPVAPLGPGGEQEVAFGVAGGKHVAVLNPAAFCLAPEGNPRKLQAALRLRVPEGWTVAGALPRASEAPSGTVTFTPVSLYTLVDSPLMTGAHHKRIPLAAPEGDVPHTLDLFGDTAELVAQKEATVVPLMTRLVAESGRMFGTRHYRAFHFMLALSHELRRFGLEHHESVAYVLQPEDLDPKRPYSRQGAWNAMLIPHEFVHSWNGKFRRPYGEDPARNTDPQSADLIWVYEGLTEYLGEVLMVRCGFRSPEDWRRDLTDVAATLRFGPGRDWQPLADAALTAPHVYVSGTGTSLRSTGDLYHESLLVWLEADAIIRRTSAGKRSLDDFCRLFFGGPNRGSEVLRYTLEDVVQALERTEPGHDWSTFVRQRFYTAPAGLPTAGLEAAGWRLVFGDAPPDQAPEPFADYRHSLGAIVTTQPTGSRLVGIVSNSPAERAGLESGTSLLGVNGSLFTPARLREALRATRGGKTGLELLVAEGDKYRTVRLEGLDGERFATLERNLTRPDLLTAIVTPTVQGP